MSIGGTYRFRLVSRDVHGEHDLGGFASVEGGWQPGDTIVRRDRFSRIDGVAPPPPHGSRLLDGTLIVTRLA